MGLQMTITAERLGGIVRAANRAGYGDKAVRTIALLAIDFQVKKIGDGANGKAYYSFRVDSAATRSFVTGSLGVTPARPRETSVTGVTVHASELPRVDSAGWDQLESAFSETDALAVMQAFIATMAARQRRG